MPNTKGQPQTQYVLLAATKKGKKNLFGDRNRALGGNAPSCTILSSSLLQQRRSGNALPAT